MYLGDSFRETGDGAELTWNEAGTAESMTGYYAQRTYLEG